MVFHFLLRRIGHAYFSNRKGYEGDFAQVRFRTKKIWHRYVFQRQRLRKGTLSNESFNPYREAQIQLVISLRL